MARKAVLAVCTTALGDTLMCTPVLADLAASFQVDVIAHQRWAPLLENNPHLREVYTYRNNDFIRCLLALRLLPFRYHRVLVLHANGDIVKLLKLLRWEQAAAVQEFTNPPQGLTVIPRDPDLHFVNQRLALSRWAGAAGQDSPLAMYLAPEEETAGADWLSARGLEPGKPLVFLCPGAALDYKRWPVEHFAQVAAGLASKGCQVAVTGSAGEVRLHERIARDCPQAVSAMGLDLRLAGAVLKRAALLITNDTGPMHLAMAVGTRVLAIFGPSLPHGVGPPRTGAPGGDRASQARKLSHQKMHASPMSGMPGAGGHPGPGLGDSRLGRRQDGL